MTLRDPELTARLLLDSIAAQPLGNQMALEVAKAYVELMKAQNMRTTRRTVATMAAEKPFNLALEVRGDDRDIILLIDDGDEHAEVEVGQLPPGVQTEEDINEFLKKAGEQVMRDLQAGAAELLKEKAEEAAAAEAEQQ